MNSDFFINNPEITENVQVGIADLTSAEELYMRAGMSWIMGASEDIFREIESDPQHLYRPLVRQLYKTYADQRIAQMAYNVEPLLPEDIESEYLASMTDNLASSMQIMKQRQKARERRRKDTTPEKLERIILSDIVRLGDVASMNSKAFQIIQNSENWLVEEGTSNNPICRYAHQSLRQGPWHIRHFCAGQYVIRSASSYAYRI